MPYAGGGRTGARVRAALGWLPAVVVVPLAMAGAIQVAQPTDHAAAMLRLHPLDVGTTWVYAVTNNGKPSGTRTKQVGAQAGLGDSLLDAVALTSHYTDYPGQGDTSNLLYEGVRGDALLQYGLVTGSDYLLVDPPAPAYELPLKAGHTWDYSGKVGTIGLSYDVTLEDVSDVEVGGHTFTGCAHFVSHMSYTFESGPGDPETLEEWTCPGYGPVRTLDTVEAQHVRLDEELTEFHGAAGNWYAAPPAPVAATPVAGDTVAFDAGRSRTVATGSLSSRLAWSESPSTHFAFPPVADRDVTVLAEEDGEVWARDVTSGQVAWRVRLTGPVVAPSVIA